MFQPSDNLQNMVGVSLIIVSIGGAWAAISGAVVKGKIAGATFSVNDKLEVVEEVSEDAINTVRELKEDSAVPRSKIESWELQLQDVHEKTEEAESEVIEDLQSLIGSRVK